MNMKSSEWESYLVGANRVNKCPLPATPLPYYNLPPPSAPKPFLPTQFAAVTFASLHFPFATCTNNPPLPFPLHWPTSPRWRTESGECGWGLTFPFWLIRPIAITAQISISSIHFTSNWMEPLKLSGQLFWLTQGPIMVRLVSKEMRN